MGGGSAVGKNEPGLAVDELEDSFWPKIRSKLVVFAVRDVRGEASGEIWPKVGFNPWFIAFRDPVSAEPPTDVAIAEDAVEADVLGEVTGLWLTACSVCFNLDTDPRPFSDVILTEIGVCGRLELAGRFAVVVACGDKAVVPVEPSSPSR